MRSTPETAKLRVFVSYSRSDVDFADQLCAALAAYGIAPSIDREGIHGAEKWQERLGQLILEADTIVFILTPASAVSDICKWEVDEAVRLNKRVVPIIWRPLGEAKPHDHLRSLNYIYFYEEPAVTGSGFGTGLMRLVEALTTNVGWTREHTRLGELAARWERDGRPGDALPRGMELARLRNWRDERPANAPELTDLQRVYLAEAEQAEAERNNAERRQLDEMRAAQEAREKALEASARAQRRNRYFVGLALLFAVLLFAGAIWQSRETERREALVMTSAAEKAIQAGFYERAMRIAIQGLPKPRNLPFVSLGWEAPEIRGLEAKLAGAAQASALRLQLEGHNAPVTRVVFSPDGGRILTASLDHTARIWSGIDGVLILTLRGHNDYVTDAVFSVDGTRIMTASDDGTARIWDSNTGANLLSLQGRADGKGMVSVSLRARAAFSPNGMRAVTTFEESAARIWDTKTGRPLGTLEGDGLTLQGPSFSRDGAHIIANSNRAVMVWDPVDLGLRREWKCDQLVMRATYSQDGKRVVTNCSNKTVCLRDTETGALLPACVSHDDLVTSAALSNDGRHLLTASRDRTARLWDTETGVLLLSLADPNSTIHKTWAESDAALSPDGERVITVFEGNMPRVWDIKSGAPLLCA